MITTSYPRFPGDGVGSFIEPIAKELPLDALSTPPVVEEPPDGGGPGGGPSKPPAPPAPLAPPGPFAKAAWKTPCNSVAWSLVSLPDDTSFCMRSLILDWISLGDNFVPPD